jgi:hypothetical protein
LGLFEDMLMMLYGGEGKSMVEVEEFAVAEREL